MRAARRPDEDRDCTKRRGLHRTGKAIRNRLSVSCSPKARGLHFQVEFIVEKHDLAFDFAASEGVHFGKIVDDDDLGCQAFRGCGDTAAQGGQYDLLGCAWGHALKFDQFAAFLAADPVRHHYLLQTDLKAELPQFFGDILDGTLRLRRA